MVELQDGAGRVRVAGAARAGDWVLVEPAGPPEEMALTRVIASPGGGEFPLPRGDWARLRLGDGRRLANLRKRALALAAARRYLDAEGFLEIEAPLLVPAPGLEVHLDAFPVEDRYLVTSPEYQLKRLLAGGLSKVYAMCRCFRRGEVGPHHEPEFTMLELYRAPGTWEAVAADVERLYASVMEAVAGSPVVSCRGGTIDFTPPWERLAVREAVARYAGIALEGDEPAAVLAERAIARGYGVRRDGPWDEVFFEVFLEAVEPALGRGRPTVLHDWPAPLAALARRRPDDARVVERFEAYAGGLELCNGFGELTDAVEQQERLERDRAVRRARGLPVYPIDERFLAALVEGLPPAGGVAIGVDRMVMLACGAGDIREVCAFTSDEL